MARIAKKNEEGEEDATSGARECWSEEFAKKTVAKDAAIA
jgi:hypothetical protein